VSFYFNFCSQLKNFEIDVSNDITLIGLLDLTIVEAGYCFQQGFMVISTAFARQI